MKNLVVATLSISLTALKISANYISQTRMSARSVPIARFENFGVYYRVHSRAITASFRSR